jgi:hypothetical protein
LDNGEQMAISSLSDVYFETYSDVNDLVDAYYYTKLTIATCKQMATTRVTEYEQRMIKILDLAKGKGVDKKQFNQMYFNKYKSNID